ncbi:hypothetical protein QSJ19_19715 [Gordonia sp. ABSL11-1]|uniref:hypothetical protein n=1 Tax=Gordonia sp. ABSL11-1 TaxID=3053924 RepID=UPI0025748150|nr:hypothetical protein [Gordonia sp. ABSL11-1]MDL9947765.1 hypothetical protein [Gordonia sp. ABSL11-1]
MPASQRTCSICGSTFYGRVDALYCGRSCQQKAYRARHATSTTHVTNSSPVTIPAAPSPVPPGDEWMAGRLRWYRTQADRLAEAESIPASKKKTRADAIETAHQWDGGAVIRDWVTGVMYLGVDPLGETLPASISPDVAADLARDLEAVLPRIAELTALLRGRAAQPSRQRSPFTPRQVGYEAVT